MEAPTPAVAAGPNNSLGTGIAVALMVCTVSCLVILWQVRRDKALQKAAEDTGQAKAANDDDGYEVGVYKEIPEWAAPKDGVFTFESLAKFNGIELPMCLALCGKVVNVSSSENFTPSHGYGKLWAGRETTYAMAKTSLKAEDANILDYSMADFSENEATALAGWYKHFTTKYPVVGTLKEYDGYDWSSVVKAAETQNPFGINNQARAGVAAGESVDSANAEAGSVDAKPAEQSPSAAGAQQVGLRLEKGGRYMLKDVECRPELTGAICELVDFVKDKGMFLVTLSDEEAVLVKPTDLVQPPT